MLRPFNPEGLAASPAYSHGVEATASQRMVFVSGQIGMRADGSIAEGMAAQTELAIANIITVLADAGLGAGDIAKLTIFLTDETLLDEFRATRRAALPGTPPASSLVFVKALIRPELLVEIEAIAVR